MASRLRECFSISYLSATSTTACTLSLRDGSGDSNHSDRSLTCVCSPQAKVLFIDTKRTPDVRSISAEKFISKPFKARMLLRAPVEQHLAGGAAPKTAQAHRSHRCRSHGHLQPLGRSPQLLVAPMCMAPPPFLQQGIACTDPHKQRACNNIGLVM